MIWRVTMILSISGYNWSGSGAVMDLLNEYEECKVIRSPEWYLIDQPDGIRDLEIHCCGDGSYFNGDVAIQRFIQFVKKHKDYYKVTNGKFEQLSKEYIDSLIDAEWIGNSVFDVYRLSGVESMLWNVKRYIDIAIYKLTKKKLDLCDRKMYLAVNPRDFIDKTMNYIDALVNAAGGEKQKINVVKHLVTANDPLSCLRYIKNGKVIIVDRDPRDLYISAVEEYAKCFPTKNIEDFVKYYSAWRIKDKVLDDRILRIQYEDLDYDYDETIKKIEKFLNIKNHLNKYMYFNPNKSINNTQLFKYANEVEYIEKNLKEYLYDFR